MWLLKTVVDGCLQWHSLDRGEQAKYYEMARKEKELHMQLYPGWSARDNYGCHTKKKKRKRPSTECDNNNGSQNTDSGTGDGRLIS